MRQHFCCALGKKRHELLRRFEESPSIAKEQQ
jgi:hypothetical protein